MSRSLPGDDAPHPDDDGFDKAPTDGESNDEVADVADRRPRWWSNDLGATPVIAVGLAIATVVVVIALVFALTLRESAPPEQNTVVQPAIGPAGAPKAVGAVDPGTCTISNLRTAHVPLSGFGGQPSLMFNYQFAQGQQRLGPRVLVAVVTEPGEKPATTTLSPLMDDSGTVAIAPLGLGAFPRGTTVYLGDQINAGPDGLPRRVSNILTLE